MKKLLVLILAAILLFGVCGCAKKEKSEDLTVNVGFLKGPTGMCGAQILENADEYGYNCTVAAAPTEITAALVSGELDIAAVPTNAAATLYNKTEGDVQIAALTTGSVLYILTGNGIELDSRAELRGRTIYATGQGANPEFVLKYLL